MKPIISVTHLTWSDSKGGAARAASRINEAFNVCNNIESRMLTNEGFIDAEGITFSASFIDKMSSKIQARLDRLPLFNYQQKPQLFSPAMSFDRVQEGLSRFKSDILHLHWINNGYLGIESIAKFKSPIVWTLHDMWPFTGGCHYTNGCLNYLGRCGRCPVLNSNKSNDLSSIVIEKKYKAFSNKNLSIVSPSSWLANIAKSSTLFSECKISVIPNCIDTNVFFPRNKMQSRKRLDLFENAAIIVFGALSAEGDQRKGGHFLPEILKRIKSYVNFPIQFVTFGSEIKNIKNIFPDDLIHLGFFDDDSNIIDIFSASDVLLLPSLEDNLPNNVMEAGSCGLPAVAFNVGGIPDLIQHQINGYLARPYDIDDFVNGILWILERGKSSRIVNERSREFVMERFSYQKVAEKYQGLYRSILDIGVI